MRTRRTRHILLRYNLRRAGTLAGLALLMSVGSSLALADPPAAARRGATGEREQVSFTAGSPEGERSNERQPGRNDRERGRNGDRGDGGNRPPPPRGWERPEPSEEEWTRAAAFWKQHAPVRWKMFEEEQHDGRRRFVKRFIVWQFHSAEELKFKDKTLYDFRLRRIRLDDKVFDMSTRLKAAQISDEERQRRRGELKDAVRALVDLDVKERHARIERLKRELSREEQGLEKRQQGTFDEMVDREFEEVLKRAEGFNRARGGRGDGRNNDRDDDNDKARPRGENERSCRGPLDSALRSARTPTRAA